MPSVVRLSFDDPADFGRWREYVQARPDAHCADLPEWPLLYREVYGFDHHGYVCVAGGRTVGALLLYHIRSPFLGRMLVTCPFFGYGGLYWDSDGARDALLDQAQTTARELRVDYVEMRHAQALPPPYQANTDFAEFDLELKATPEETWTALAPNVRQNVRRSRTQGLEFRMSADYRPCYDLLRRTLREHGTPFHGERFFRSLTERLGTRVRYAEVRHGGRVVAGGVTIQFKESMITPYIGSLVRSRDLRANYLQYWELIEQHCPAQGIRRFEMGRSPRGSTHAQFKLKWGAREVPLFYNYLVLDPGRGYRSVSRPSAVQRLATHAWKRLPLALTTALGPRLFRYIP